MECTSNRAKAFSENFDGTVRGRGRVTMIFIAFYLVGIATYAEPTQVQVESGTGEPYVVYMNSDEVLGGGDGEQGASLFVDVQGAPVEGPVREFRYLGTTPVAAELASPPQFLYVEGRLRTLAWPQGASAIRLTENRFLHQVFMTTASLGLLGSVLTVVPAAEELFGSSGEKPYAASWGVSTVVFVVNVIVADWFALKVEVVR